MKTLSLRSTSAALAFCATLLATGLAHATPASVCGAPVTARSVPFTSDCLFILRVAVGLATCSPECVCAPVGSLPVTVSNALLCLKAATGQSVMFDCPCDPPTTTTIPPPPPPGDCSGGDPSDIENSVGVCMATYGRAILPGFVPGLPGLDEETFSGSAGFVKVTGVGPGGDPSTEEQEFGDCTVFISEPNTDPPIDPPGFEILDPGNPGTISNGSTTVDLEEGELGTFVPEPELLPLGFDAGQSITFAFPGGADINQFNSCVDVPERIVVTSPDLTADDLEIVSGDPFTLSWEPAPDQDGELFLTITSVTTGFGFIGTGGATSESVSIVCMFDDASGTGTVPAGATALLPEEAPLGSVLTTAILLSRENYVLVDVTGSGVSGNDNVVLIGSATIARTLTAFDIPFPIRD